MYGMTNSVKLFTDDSTEWSIESGFIQYQFQLSIYYKYAPYGTKMLLYLMLMIVFIDISIKLLEMVCGHSRKDISCKIPGICTLVYFNQDFKYEGPFHFSRLGYICYLYCG